MLTVDEVFDVPQVTHRGTLLPPGVAGPVAQAACPIRLSESPATVRRGAPAWGADTRDVLQEAGYGDAEIVGLVAAGAIR